jgi:hypothetical protein
MNDTTLTLPEANLSGAMIFTTLYGHACDLKHAQPASRISTNQASATP